MTDLDAILATVLDRPEDDTARLVYADALEDTGEPANCARAEFIRVQIEWSQLARKQDEFLMADISSFDHDRATVNRRQKELLNRSHQLFANSGPPWWNHLPGKWRATVGADSIETADGIKYFIRRGFIHTVRGPLAALRGGEECPHCDRGVQWRSMPPDSCVCESCGGDPALRKPGTGRTPGVLADLVRREPVERVEVVDREPYRESDKLHIWYDGLEYSEVNIHRESNIPREIYVHLENYAAERVASFGKEYRTEQLARAALSRALLLEAKQKAAVPA